MKTLVLEGLVAWWEPLPRVVQSSCVVRRQLWGICVTVLRIRPHFRTQWEGEESLARCGRLYQFQIVYRNIFSDSTRRRWPKMNLWRRNGVASIALKQQRLSESFCPNQFCNLRNCRWLIERSPVRAKTHCCPFFGLVAWIGIFFV